MRIKINEILASKGNDAWAISPDATVYQAIEMMADKGVGALAVTAADKLTGIVSERDYARKVILKGESSKVIKVSSIMSSEVVTVTGEHHVDECMNLMTEHHIRHLPVVEGENLIGMISVGDLVKSIMQDQSSTIEHLEGYIRRG